MRLKWILMISIAMLLVMGLGWGVVYWENTRVMFLPRAFEMRLPIPINSIFDTQSKIELAFKEQALLHYNMNEPTYENPYIVQDPYNFNPLSAFVLFYNFQPMKVLVTVQGKDDATTLQYVHQVESGLCYVPILGLMPENNNIVILRDEDGRESILEIQTSVVPEKLKNLTNKIRAKESQFVMAVSDDKDSYFAIFDGHGQIRGYFSNIQMAHQICQQASNGNLILSMEDNKGYPAENLESAEVNLAGKVFCKIYGNVDIHSQNNRLIFEESVGESNYSLFPIMMYSSESYDYGLGEKNIQHTGQRPYSEHINNFDIGSWYSRHFQLQFSSIYIEQNVLIAELNTSPILGVESIVLLLHNEGNQYLYAPYVKTEDCAIWNIDLSNLKNQDYLLDLAVISDASDGYSYKAVLPSRFKLNYTTKG